MSGVDISRVLLTVYTIILGNLLSSWQCRTRDLAIHMQEPRSRPTMLHYSHILDIKHIFKTTPGLAEVQNLYHNSLLILLISLITEISFVRSRK